MKASILKIKRYNNEKEKLKECKEFARAKNGKCLSTKYINNHTKMLWECEFNHQWKTTFANIKGGNYWCPHCAKNAKLTLIDCQKTAKERGGKCLSKEYKNSSTKMQWSCNKGHIWYATSANIRFGQWCPYCSGRYITLKDCKEIAKKRGGKCLSLKYLGSKNIMEWKCKKGHVWKARLEYIKQGSWCPYCSTGKTENMCRSILENIFNTKFKKCRPKWLVNLETGNRLEFDGYSEKLKIAFEYQGEQHYTYKNIPFMTKEKFEALQKRDNIKRNLCKKYDVILIEIPFLKKTNYERVFMHIKKILKNIKVKSQYTQLATVH